MVAIDNILVSDEIFTEQFVCDLQKCKGGCCVEGDCGAPLNDKEAEVLSEAYPKVKDLLNPESKKIITKEGYYTTDSQFGKVTPTIEGGMCAYGYLDEQGIVKCALDTKFREGKSAIPKPISCALFPIRVSERDGYIILNYEPRPGLCDPACTLGHALKMPVYKFLKEPIIRRFGKDFYTALDTIAEQYFSKP